MNTFIAIIMLILGFFFLIVGVLIYRIATRSKYITRPCTIADSITDPTIRSRNKRDWDNYYRSLIE